MVSRTQLRELGLTRGQIRNLMGPHGRWVAVTDEVVRRCGAPGTIEQRTAAAVLDAGPDAVLSHLSAAAWWGLHACPSTPIHVTKVRSSSRRPSLATVHRIRQLPPGWTTTHRGVAVVRPELLALQLHAVCHEQRAERLVDRLWSMRLLSGQSLGRFLAQLAQRGVPGWAGLRRYHAERGETYRPPDSGLESRFQQIVRELGVAFRRQVDTGDEEGWTGRVDVRHPTLPLVVEIQSEAHHSSLVDRETDRRRLGRLRASGYTVVEVTDTMVWTSPAAVRRAVMFGIRAASSR